MNYIFYLREDKGVKEVAKITDGKISGEMSDPILKLLVRSGYPDVDPTRILHGSIMWAEEILTVAEFHYGGASGHEPHPDGTPQAVHAGGAKVPEEKISLFD